MSPRAINDANTPIYDPSEHDVMDTSFESVNSQVVNSKTSEGCRRIRRIPTIVAPLTDMVSRATCCGGAAVLIKVAASAILLVSMAIFLSPSSDEQKVVRVAMIGNSIMYYNDMPRVLEAMGQGHLEQNSCLHGNADFGSHLWYGNGMYDKWLTGQARMWGVEDTAIYDFGACSVQHLLFGKDDRLFHSERQYDVEYNEYDENDDANATVAPQDAWQYELLNDETNPCLVDSNYNAYQQALYETNGRPEWDFVVLNDNTRNPCCTEQREASMELLADVYLPWLNEIQAIPIFMVTYGYWASHRDMSGLTDVPTFESLTYNGYEEYVRLATEYLPENLKPRIAPVGLAFLMVYEETPSIWQDLMHTDDIHLSPSGTFLQACVVYAAIYGKLPPTSIFDGEGGPEQLFRWSRRMVPTEHQMKPYPTVDLAQYLYHIAYRVAILGETPRSLTIYPANTSVDFTPDDSLYSAAQTGKS